jgi:hypothetical protein
MTNQHLSLYRQRLFTTSLVQEGELFLLLCSKPLSLNPFLIKEEEIEEIYVLLTKKRRELHA